jgi:signal transduction histidine kinase
MKRRLSKARIIIIGKDTATIDLVAAALEIICNMNPNIRIGQALDDISELSKNIEPGGEALLIAIEPPIAEVPAWTLDEILARYPSIPTIVIGKSEELELAQNAISKGAQDYLRVFNLNPERLFRACWFALERQTIRNALQDAHRQLSAQAEARKRFLAQMSHEIRTPLTTIVGNLALLNHSQLTESQQKIVNSAHTSSNLLLQVVNEILDVSRVDAGCVPIVDASVDIVALAEEVVKTFVPLALPKGLLLIVVGSPALPQSIRGDEQRLRQILTNLISNGIKNTEQGFVLIRIFFTIPRESEEAGELTLEVEDTG